MWRSEEEFPRGRIEFSKKFHSLKVSNELTLQCNPEGSDGERKKLKRKKVLVSTKDVKRRKQDVNHIVFKAPLQDEIATGLCVLGCIKRVFQHTISISLPGNLMGKLPVSELSTTYAEHLKKIADNEATDFPLEDIKPLSELFRPGMLIPVQIEKIVEKQKKKKILLTSNPSKMNSSVSLKALTDGMLLFGSISSLEDHGYSVDVGIAGLKAFLSNKNADTLIKVSTKGSPLCVGHPIWCVAQIRDQNEFLRENRVLPVSVDPSAVQSSLLTHTQNLNCFLPGMNLKGIVQNVLDCGLIVSVFSFQGHVHVSQLPNPPDKFSIGQQLNLKLLYVDVNSKILHLTALPKLVHFDGRPIKFFADLDIGDIYEAKVTWIQKKKGVYFHLPHGTKGFADMTHLSDKKSETPDLQKFSVHSLHQCRILGFNYMEALALITLRKSTLQKKFFNINETSVGDMIDVVVHDVAANGVLVKLAKSFFSFITCLHLADVPIKHPEKKFSVGKKLKCRVMKIDIEKNKLFLTHKRSLVKTKYPIITEYSQLKPHMELEGYISAFKDKSVIVSFFNDVKGYVVLKDMSTELVNNPHELFYVGQVIKCRVVYFNVPEKRLKLSFNLGDVAVNVPENTLDCSVQKINVGDIVSVDSTGYTLVTLKKKQAYLPYNHLSDFHEVQELRKLAFKSGQRLTGLTFFKQKDKLIVTMKESFVTAAEQNLIEKFQDLKAGMLLPAVIKNHQDYGMFLEIINGYTGLCPSKTLSYLQPSNLQELFQPGQSVITRLIKIDAEKQRFLGSIHINECSESGVDSSIVLLKTYLHSRGKAQQQLFAQNIELQAYKNLKVGDVVQVIVNSVLKKGILCDTTCGAKGLVTKDNLGDMEPKSGKSYRAVVLYIDLLTPCIELTLDSKVVQSVLSHKENLKSQVKKNQTLKAKILLVKPEFILVGLRGHGNGKFAYVPVRKHLNDVDFNTSYKLGCLAEVILKDFIDEFQLAIFKKHDLELNTSTEEKTQSLDFQSDNTLVGTVFEAKIRTIHAFQMNIVINKFHGRVHITEVSDNVEDGENPFSNYHPEQVVKVKVIGLRDILTHKYLPLTGSDKTHILLECSMKESRMNQETSDLTHKYEINKGKKVMAYVTKVTHGKVWVQISPCQQGCIDLFQLSADTDVLNNASSHFLPGQGYHATVIHFENEPRIALSLLEHEITLAENEEVTAVITNTKCGKCFYVKLPFGRVGVVNQKPSVLNYVGQYIKCRIDSLKTDSDIFALSLLNQSDLPSRKVRKRRNSLLSKAQQSNSQTETPKTKIKKIENSKDEKKTEISQDEVHRLTINGFSWKGEIPCSGGYIDENSDSDGEQEKIKNESIELRKKRKHSEEMRIQEHEYDQIKNIPKVQSSADYEKLVLQSPNSSVIWIAYMTHHIELGEIEKARSVAERALNTILFREEQEKLNIWVAYLNMETIYGDPVDVKTLLDRAVTFNNPLDINLKMCDIYVANGNNLEAEKLFKKMTERYKHEKLIWKSYGQFLFKNGQVDIARNSLQRALLVLDKRHHVEVIIKYATLEFSHGDIERGRTIFENLIASYPGRTDIWSVYVDMVVKAGDIPCARLILERAVKQKVNAKKLSFLIQKFKKFEETYGTEEEVEKVNELATAVLN